MGLWAGRGGARVARPEASLLWAFSANALSSHHPTWAARGTLPAAKAANTPPTLFPSACLQHAGMVPGVPLRQQHMYDFTTMVNCVPVVSGPAAEDANGSEGASSSSSSSSSPSSSSRLGADSRRGAVGAARHSEGDLCSSGSSLSSLDLDGLGSFELVASATVGGSSGSSRRSGGSSTSSSSSSTAGTGIQGTAAAAACDAEAVQLSSSSSLSSLDMDGTLDSEGFELVAAASIGGSSSSGGGGGGGGGGSSEVSSGGGSSSSSGGGTSGCVARFNAKLNAAKIRERASGLDWRDALAAYVRQCGAGSRPRSGQAQAAAGTRGVAAAQQQQQQQQQPSSAAAASEQVAAAAPAAASRAAGSAAAALQTPAPSGQLQQGPPVELVGTKRQNMGVPWARAWSEFQQAAPERHAWLTYGCMHAVFGHDVKR